MKFKVIFSAVTVACLWWFLVRAKSPPKPVVKAVPTKHPTHFAGLAATAKKLKDMPQQVAIAPSSPQSIPNNIGQVAPIPQVATARAAVPPIVLQPRALAIDAVTDRILQGLMAAIISQESSGDPTLQHPVSKAMGLGQVLPENIPEWTQETFGQALTVEQFRNSPDAQLYVIRQKLFQYYGRAIAASGGDLHLAVRRVAAQWYSGQADLYDSSKPVATGPSIRDYTLQVLSRFQNFYPQNYIVRYRASP